MVVTFVHMTFVPSDVVRFCWWKTLRTVRQSVAGNTHHSLSDSHFSLQQAFLLVFGLCEVCKCRSPLPPPLARVRVSCQSLSDRHQILYLTLAADLTPKDYIHLLYAVYALTLSERVLRHKVQATAGIEFACSPHV